MEAVMVGVVVVLVVLNLASTAAVGRSASCDLRQKLVQLAFIWLVPFIGAILAWTMAREPLVERHATDLTNTYSPDDGDLRLREAGGKSTPGSDVGDGSDG